MVADRSDGDGTGRHRPAKGEGEQRPEAPIERSSRGRIVIRSSSHPPVERPAVTDDLSGELSGAKRLPAADADPTPRTKRDTPAERPRRRRQVRAAQLAEWQRREASAAQAPSGQRRRSPAGVARHVAPGAPPDSTITNDTHAGRDMQDAGPVAGSEAAPIQSQGPTAPRRRLALRAAAWLLGAAVAAWLMARWLAG